MGNAHIFLSPAGNISPGSACTKALQTSIVPAEKQTVPAVTGQSEIVKRNDWIWVLGIYKIGGRNS